MTAWRALSLVPWLFAFVAVVALAMIPPGGLLIAASWFVMLPAAVAFLLIDAFTAPGVVEPEA
jgi:hypothetical protein